MPLSHEPGAEAEVDWGQAQVTLRGERRAVHLFLMRACHSGASFVVAFEAETQQAFLEGHVAALEFFGGVFELIRYDNLRSAVAKVLKGRRRVESDRFIALRSHYRFESSFCQRGERGAHEKGGIEGEVGRFRRRRLVPVPKVDSLQELNELLEEACWCDLERTIIGRSEPVGEMLRTRAGAAGRPAPRATLHRRGGIAAGRHQGDGHGPPEPLLGPGPPGGDAGPRQGRRAADLDLATTAR